MNKDLFKWNHLGASPEQDEFLIRNFGKASNEDLAIILGMSENMVKSRAFNLGLSKGKPLNDAQQVGVLEARKSRSTPTEISRILKLPIRSVVAVIMRSEEPKTRKCLSCEDDFSSIGSSNRVCPSCKNTKKWRNGHDVLGMEGLYS